MLVATAAMASHGGKSSNELSNYILAEAKPFATQMSLGCLAGEPLAQSACVPYAASTANC